ncbi:HAD family hydrolase [Nocardioides marmotae]|uniref:HAD family hydrolase n=1 Tax=Nocardioides marmotae TaxID=2663857 RepID=UPI0012B51677|nr:HAD family hydrolase [Nocardioides marmotae]MBC9734784.1 HAD family hydrolase [Nocardioides marmotae]MTB85885.1 HAD-IA family hydrolase [Nocardioides marmotae]
MTGSRSPSSRPDTVVLDLDGTLVDSVYVHVGCWRAAFRDVGVDVASYRLHRAIGMGGDKLVAEVTNESVERSVGDDVRARHAHHFDERFGEVVALEGAEDLLAALRGAGLQVVLASSGERALTDRLLDLVPGTSAIRSTLAGDEAEASKPAPDLLAASLERVGAKRAFAVGDTVWDAEAARAAGAAFVGVLTGGITEAELRDAGAVAVVAGPHELAARLDEVLSAVAGALPPAGSEGGAPGQPDGGR